MAEPKGLYLTPEPEDLKQALIIGMQSSAPLIMIGENGITALVHVSSDVKAATEWLRKLATKYNKPIGCNYNNETIFIAPTSWSKDKLMGYVGAHADILEGVYGNIERMRFMENDNEM